MCGMNGGWCGVMAGRENFNSSPFILPARGDALGEPGDWLGWCGSGRLCGQIDNIDGARYLLNGEQSVSKVQPGQISYGNSGMCKVMERTSGRYLYDAGEP